MRLEADAPDAAFLWDMREAGLGIIRLTRTVSFEDFCADLELIAAVERGVSIIGRAARLVSGETRESCPDVPFRVFTGMARLVDDSGDAMEAEELWQMVEGLPAMVRAIAAIMPADDDDARA